MDRLHHGRVSGQLRGQGLLAARLALKDLLYERTHFLCQILALAAVLAPLLILYGLKTGVLETLARGLSADADVRQITIRGLANLPEDQLEALRNDPLVGFVAPHPHPINADTFFAVAGRRAARTIQGTILGSGPGDPLLPPGATPPAPGQTYLSAGLARDLGVTAGHKIVLLAERNQGETALLPLAILGVLQSADWSASGALLNADDILAVDRWSEGYKVPALGETGRPLEEMTIPTLRLFAADISSVRPLATKLSDAGLNLRTQVSRIEGLEQLSSMLGVVFATIAGVAGLGYLVSFSASLWANVSRKTAELSILRLQGLSRGASLAFPATQALLIALGGWLGATLLYLFAAWLLNRSLGADFALALGQGFDALTPGQTVAKGDISLLQPYHYVVAALISLAVALLAAATAARRLLRIDPAEGMRSA